MKLAVDIEVCHCGRLILPKTTCPCVSIEERVHLGHYRVSLGTPLAHPKPLHQCNAVRPAPPLPTFGNSRCTVCLSPIPADELQDFLIQEHVCRSCRRPSADDVRDARTEDGE